MKIFQMITPFPFINYSFIELNILVSLPKSFLGPLDSENALQLTN